MAKKTKIPSLDHLGTRKGPPGGNPPIAAPTVQTRANAATGQPVGAPEGLARYVITFELTTIAPFHLGSGEERLMDEAEAPDDSERATRPWVAEIVRTREGVPCIPGASLKGALRARALAAGHPHPSQTRVLIAIFGEHLGEVDEGQASTNPGSAEFRFAVAVGRPAEYLEARTAIDRVTRTVVDGKLFHQDTVQPGARFSGTVVLPSSTADEAAALAGLLGSCNEADPLTLGAQGRAGWGRMVVEKVDARVLSVEGVRAWWAQPLEAETGSARDWLSFTVPVRLPQSAASPRSRMLVMPLQIAFEGPFAVRDPRQRKGGANKDEPDIRPRQRGRQGAPDERPLLPSTSFLGALRSQAERILRTLGLPATQGHRAAKAPTAAPPDELVSLLFGCAGWRGVVGIGEELQGLPGTPRIEQDMIALCRITGGVKGGAKFAVAGWAKPQLNGTLTLDAERLRRSHRWHAALGLLKLVMLDLAEGDITFGLGRSKGWGWVKPEPALSEGTLQDFLRSAVGAEGTGDGTDPSALCVAALAALSSPETTPPAIAPSATVTEHPGETIPELPTLFRGPGHKGGEFHNPYHFLPFARLHGAPTQADDAALGQQAEALGHSHDRYAPGRLSGRITVELTTVTPLFIGAKRTEGGPANTPVTVQPFMFDGQRAIPGTSLRGMLSSLIEPMSGSAMRVLDDDTMISVRMAAREEEFLPYRGVVVEAVDEDGQPALAVEEWPPVEGRGEDALWPIDPRAIGMLHALADERWNAKGKDLDLDDPGVRSKSRTHVPPAARFDRAGRPDPTRKGNLDLLPAIDWTDNADHSSRRNPDPAKLGTRARLMPGQIVYFDLDHDGQTVIELAWSALYRRSHWADDPRDPGPLNVRRFVGLAGQNRSRLPLGLRSGNGLHAAEWLLGVAEDNVEEGKAGKAFAGKVIVGMGRATAAVKTLGPIPLKELSSPKPPSPALYIRRVDGKKQRVRKDDLVRKPSAFRFQGTKTYVHAWQEGGKVKPLDERGGTAGNTAPWQSLRPDRPPSPAPQDKDYRLSNRQVQVNPIADGQKFSFEVRFDNLSGNELNLLFAALHPSERYVHRLGMGRPIGLGSVKLGITGVMLEDRGRRYRTGTRAGVSPPADGNHLAQQGMAELHKRDPALHNALLALGEPQRVRAPVHYPQLAGHRIEDRNYQWWVSNDKLDDNEAQVLQPISAPRPDE